MRMHKLLGSLESVNIMLIVPQAYKNNASILIVCSSILITLIGYSLFSSTNKNFNNLFLTAIPVAIFLIPFTVLLVEFIKDMNKLSYNNKEGIKEFSHMNKNIKTKWLKFWNYVSLPIGGVIYFLIGFLIFDKFPVLGIFLVLLSFLYFVVIYGLHYRKLWAYQCNWIIIIIVYLSMSIPISPNESSNNYLIGQFIIKLFLSSLIWMWPNYVYWKKRRNLFFSKS